ncbi:MAG TPA: hypothetical protein VH144_00385 [Candidatus Saccharimonadales bacterium]|jgi:hypothetical protein|nr:hypothetical protein [Candidatus Saccharimonadales bacterium]
MKSTLGAQPIWLIRHRKLVLYIVAAVIVVLVALMITFTVMANNAATSTTQQVKDVTYNLKTNLQAFGKRAAALDIKTSADADKTIAQLDSLRTALAHAQLPHINAPPLANIYSPSYNNAARQLAAARSQIASVTAAVAAITDFAHYSRSTAAIFENPALAKGITDTASATACADAWTTTKAALAKITPPTSVKATHQALLTTSGDVAAYCVSLADAYKKTDRTALAAGQAELDKRIQAVRTAGTDLDTTVTQLAAALNAAVARLN